MKLTRYILLFFLIIFISKLSFAQRTKFTSDTAYLSDLKIFMGLVDKKDPDPVFTQFTALWDGGNLNNNQKKAIIEVSNNLLKKRARPNPHFDNLLKYVISVQKSEKTTRDFDTWMRVLQNYSTSAEFNLARLDKLISDLLVFNDSSVLYQTRAVKWKYTNNQFKIGFDLNGTVRLSFPRTDIICFAKGDSTMVSQTSGFYYPVSDQWRGNTGTVTWERAGYSKDSVFVRLNNYFIDLKFSEFKADTVEFTNKKYLKTKLVGRFEERVLANVNPDKASYPKFYSFDKTIDIKQVVPGIDYSGGFAMEGSKFNGFGDAIDKAKLFIYKGKELFAKASAISFVFDKNNIIANNAKVIIFIDQDTLWHPGLYFNFLIKSDKVALTRSGEGLFRSNFYDSYHKLEIDISEISFGLKDTLVLFKSPPATTYRKGIFQSSNYFSSSAYQEVALMDRVHPLEAIRNIAPSVGVEFEAIDLASYLNKAETYGINMLTRLSDMGFVNFDLERKIAYPEQKLFDYIKGNFGKKDYDAISIVSEPPKGNNGVLNLKDNVLTVNGVKSFVLSNNRRVGVIPDNSSIRIKKNLEIDFDGQLQAGLTWLYGKNMTFNYDSFYIELERTDSLTMTYKSETKQKDSAYTFTPVASTIDSISGLLRIDFPQNKSGIKTFHTYPILESHKKSYVFYDQQTKTDTVYGKNRFYVENYPFEIDSLNTIIAKNITFKGNLNSGGVFPRFDENLVVMKDNSLGFIHKLDSTGMPVYDGIAKYNNTVKLDNSGLKGDGSIKYLNSVIYASIFNFFPDSMNTYASHIDMQKQKMGNPEVRYPNAVADSVYIFWAPKKNQMLITSLDKPFEIFENKAQLKGTLELRTDELLGEGILKISDAQLDSKTYTFYDESLNAISADFIINPAEGEKIPFLTYNVKSDIDFDKKLGIFKSNGNNSYIDLPVNQYKCYMNYFSWHMGINQVDIGTTLGARNDSIQDIALADSLSNNNGGVQVAFTDTSYTSEELASSSRFVSTHPNQDSLAFYATSSSYDIKNFIVKAKGVKFIKVADAIVFPSTTVTILPEATIKTLENSRILVDRTSSFHKFYDASVNILGAKRYGASGDYEYYDRQDSLQMIHFNNISVNTDIQTIASGEIKEDDLFKLSPEFSYFGNISLKAPVKDIEFDGFTKINHLCEQRLQVYWIQFKSIINPDSIVIPLNEQIVDNEFRKLQTDLFLTADSMGVYPGFLTTKRRINDVPILHAKGKLYFNTRSGYYEITDSSKLQNPEMEGNYLSFHRKLCLVLGEGKMDMGATLGHVIVSPVGFVRYNLDAWQAQLNIMLGIDFFFNDAALSAMASKINESYTLPAVGTDSKEYQRSMKELLGLKERDRLMNDIALSGGFSSIPSEMNKTMFFSDVKMKWNNSQNAWQSDGKIGLGNLKGTQVNKMLDGYIEVKKLKSGDILNIYLEVDPKNWYFFTYTRGTMKTISSDDNYNNSVTNLKDKYRKPPVKDDNNPYMFFPATERAKENFIEEMKRQKLAALENKDVNYDNYNTNEEQSETETPEGDDVENENKNEIIIETEELKTDEVKVIEELKKNSDEQIGIETEEDENQFDNKIKPDNNAIEIKPDDTDNELEFEENNNNKEEAKKEEIKTDEIKKEALKIEDIKTDEIKKEDVKKEEIKTQEVKKEEIKIEDIKKDEIKKDDVKKEEIKKDDVKKEELKIEEVKKEEIKTQEIKIDDVKKDEIKKEEIKIQEVKKEDPKKEDVKKDELKKDENKKEDVKKQDPNETDNLEELEFEPQKNDGEYEEEEESDEGDF